MNQQPKLATHQHCVCYYRQRRIVRILFWGTIIAGAWYLIGKYGLIDDYQMTKEALGVK